MDIERFRQFPLMGIVRGDGADVIEPLVETVIAAGLETLEIAMNSPGAAEMIARASKVSSGRLAVGAGTVTTDERLEAACSAGAGFVVMPVLVDSVVRTCRSRAIPVFPGAFTPQEIWNAWQAGATMVKVFPAKTLGPEYIGEVRGPFDEVELLACGGVSAGNMQAYFNAGAAAVAFGGSVFGAQRLAERDFDAIGASVAALVEAARRATLARSPSVP
jgi:2-dehydro-3-deoxyphosphogluconate aldolase/(4S)-4-hydroxy-2-oxoglutarate aldolase